MSEQNDNMVARIAIDTGVPKEKVNEVLRAYRDRAPIFEIAELIASGLNGFAFELAVESLRKFDLFEEIGPLAFRLRGVRFVVDYDADSEARERSKREGMGLPAENPKYKTRRPVPKAGA